MAPAHTDTPSPTAAELAASNGDAELIRACRAGERLAWERVLAKYERLVYSIPLGYGLSHNEAADIAQLTFTYLIESLNELRDDSRLGGWLALVARRHTWRVLKRTRREAPREEADDEWEPTAAQLGRTATEPLERWEVLEWLNSGLSQLGERCRQLLLALYFESTEPSYQNVATRLAMPVGSVGPTRARCLDRLKQVLQRP